MGIAEKYGPWGVVAGASDGVGTALAEALAAEGINVVLVARRKAMLDEIAARLPVETRVVALDLSSPTAVAELAAVTDDIEVGSLFYNAGGDTVNELFLDRDLDELHAFVRRNCSAVLECSHHFGGLMAKRGRGGVVLVSSGAAWAGGKRMAIYGATKAFDLVLAEGLWIEWRPLGIDVLALVLGPTDTPSFHRSLAAHGGMTVPEMASPVDVAAATLENLPNGPTYSYGMPDPLGASPLAMLSRREAVELVSAGTDYLFPGKA